MSDHPAPEHSVHTGSAESMPDPLRAEMEAMARRSERAIQQFDRTEKFVTLLNDPLVQNLIGHCGLSVVLTTLQEARSRGKSFMKAVSSLDAVRASDPILCADFLFEALTAEDFSLLTQLLHAAGDSAETLEQTTSRQTQNILSALTHDAHALIRRIETAAADTGNGEGVHAQKQTTEHGRNGSPLRALAAEAHTLFQRVFLLPADPPQMHLHRTNGKKGNGTDKRGRH
ncbi:MAG: hypothetical protein WC353_03750 [Candidatus Peribacter sp.]|jgi:hypothetical protein